MSSRTPATSSQPTRSPWVQLTISIFEAARLAASVASTGTRGPGTRDQGEAVSDVSVSALTGCGKLLGRP